MVKGFLMLQFPFFLPTKPAFLEESMPAARETKLSQWPSPQTMARAS
jgi:hypothetical protein